MKPRFLTGLAVAAVAAGCATPRVSNGSVTVCYRAIPVAKAAVHDKHATLVGVHRVPVDQVRAGLPASVSAELAAENDAVVCAVALKDDFLPGQVELAPPADRGTYAVVLVSSRHLHLVDSVVLDELPKAFGQRNL